MSVASLVMSAACAPAPVASSPSAALVTPIVKLSPCVDRASCEGRTEARLAAALGDSLGTGAAQLDRFLQRLPKGGDLHDHVAGAVYAESYLEWAREDGLRLDGSLTLVPAAACTSDKCTEIPATPSDPRYEAVIRAWSMRGFTPGGKESGHDHFFSAFAKFGVVSHEVKREPDMLAETMRRAAEDGAIYIEALVTASRPLILDITHDAGEVDPRNLAAFEERLHADRRWRTLIEASRAGLLELGQHARTKLGCDKPVPAGEPPAPGCALTVRYLAQVGRTSPLPLLFANVLLAFDVSAVEPTLAGVNLVSPEDDPRSLRDYEAQMAIIGGLKDEYRGKSPLRVSLHAGELTSALLADRGPASPSSPGPTTFHIRSAVEVAHAERIGHGVDVLGERDKDGLLREMHDRGVTVEVCLTSNATILGVAGRDHPLSAYLAAGVPVVLATDDAGVSRSSLTGEFTRAVTVQGLHYRELKKMVRTSLEAAFVPGASLWESLAEGRSVSACPLPAKAADITDVSRVAPACAALLKSSPRAELQWRLEQQLLRFETE